MNQKGELFLRCNVLMFQIKVSEEVATALEIKENTEVLKLSRLRGDVDGPFVYFVSWLHPRIGLTLKEDFTRPLYEIIENDHSILVDLSREEIKAISADNFISEKLLVPKNDPILERIRKVYDPGKRPIEFCTGYYRADKFSYSIDIKREFH